VLSEYLDGELAPVRAEAVRRHVAACERCAGVLEALRAADEAARCAGAAVPGGVPDLASRVTDELRVRGAFFAARVAAAKRRLFGERRRLLHARLGAAAAVSAAAGIVLLVFAGMDQASRRDWARRTEPVLADAERVLVRLVVLDAADEPRALDGVRAQAGQVAGRLAEARRAARSQAAAADLAYLEETFGHLARNKPLPVAMSRDLAGGRALDRLSRLREDLGTRF
jgi:anti-sigma factor RsiW